MTPDDFRDARIALGYTQVQIAAVLGVHELTVRKWEMGVHRIPISVTLALKALPPSRIPPHPPP